MHEYVLDSPLVLRAALFPHQFFPDILCMTSYRKEGRKEGSLQIPSVGRSAAAEGEKTEPNEYSHTTLNITMNDLPVVSRVGGRGGGVLCCAELSNNP